MAPRKSTRKTSHSKSDGPKAVVVFWLIFAIIIVSIALFNWPTITKNFNLFKTRIANPPSTEEELLTADDEITNVTTPRAPEVVIIEPETRPNPVQTPAPQPTPPQTPPVQQQTTQPAPQPQTQQQTRPQTQTTPTPAPAPVPTPAPAPTQTRERALYFAQVTSDGQILQSKVTRRLPVSETPMQDVLNAMLAGPTQDELRRNVLNLIPNGTRLLSATVRGSTAYLNFSEDFMFNSYGVEGYVAQLRQIVYTVTEFPNVRDVQILIEGRRVDYLAEGIWIGSPLGRQ